MIDLLCHTIPAFQALTDDCPWQPLRWQLQAMAVADLFPQTAQWQTDLIAGRNGDRAMAVLTALPADSRAWSVDDWLKALPLLLAIDQTVHGVSVGKLVAAAGIIPSGPILAESEHAMLLRRGPLRRPDREIDVIPDAPQDLLIGVIVVKKRFAGAAVRVERPRFYRPAEAPRTIGFVPAIECAEELVLTELPPTGATRPRIRVEPVADTAVTERIVAATLRCVDKADWVILPESCVRPETYDAMVKALFKRNAATSLVIAGSGCYDGFNRVHVLGPGGRELWRQDKLRLWSVPLNQLSGWLHGPPAYPPPHDEATDIGDTITLIDLPVVGRILVAICEDLERDDGPLREVIHRTRSDWILSPIFDTGTGVKRWSGKRALDLSGHGATVVVAAPTGLARLERPGDKKVTIGLIARAGQATHTRPVPASKAGTGIHRILPVPPP